MSMKQIVFLIFIVGGIVLQQWQRKSSA